jgi:hypothetical protein
MSHRTDIPATQRGRPAPPARPQPPALPTEPAEVLGRHKNDGQKDHKGAR